MRDGSGGCNCGPAGCGSGGGGIASARGNGTTSSRWGRCETAAGRRPARPEPAAALVAEDLELDALARPKRVQNLGQVGHLPDANSAQADNQVLASKSGFFGGTAGLDFQNPHAAAAVFAIAEYRAR